MSDTVSVVCISFISITGTPYSKSATMPIACSLAPLMLGHRLQGIENRGLTDRNANCHGGWSGASHAQMSVSFCVAHRVTLAYQNW